METRRRSIVKSLSYRVLGTIVTALIGWLFTGSFKLGLSMGILDSAIKIGVFYGHERCWHKVKWGRIPYPASLSAGDGI